MLNLYDIAWGGLVAISAPLWLALPKPRRKVLRALRERMGRDALAHEANDSPCVMIHAVSLGEINATRALVRQLGAARPDLRFVVSTTTDTGFARGRELYGANPRVVLIRYPLDFSLAITRVLDHLRPTVVVLMELEVWPNFVSHCHRRGIPLLLMNGRLTESSYRGYRRVRPLVARSFRRLTRVCAQERSYAERFIALGADPDRVRVTGTMKFDTAQVADRIDGADALASATGLRPGHEPIWVCGSTGPGEEAIVLDVYRKLVERHPDLRLVLVPRHPERFDEVAALISGKGVALIRRSGKAAPGSNVGSASADAASSTSPTTASAKADPTSFQSAIRNPQSAIVPIILGDTMGELRKFYSLADIVLVGRSLVDLGQRQHGSDMIEPAALARPIVIGPFTHNFAEPMNQLRGANAIREVATAEELERAVRELLTNRDAARAMGARAQEVVRREQGATGRHVAEVLACLENRMTNDEARMTNQPRMTKSE